MTDCWKCSWFCACSSLAGLLVGLLIFWASLSHLVSDSVALFLPGITFGVGIAVCLRLFLGLRTIWKIAVFVAASLAANWLSVLAAFFAYKHLTFPLDAFRTRTSPVGPETYSPEGSRVHL
jgi:hypothetical protein